MALDGLRFPPFPSTRTQRSPPARLQAKVSCTPARLVLRSKTSRSCPTLDASDRPWKICLHLHRSWSIPSDRHHTLQILDLSALRKTYSVAASTFSVSRSPTLTPMMDRQKSSSRPKEPLPPFQLLFGVVYLDRPGPPLRPAPLRPGAVISLDIADLGVGRRLMLLRLRHP
jgi:hypothetical protein